MVLARADEATARASAALFAEFILEHETQHFALEESLLLPALPAGTRTRLLTERVLEDHTYLRHAAEELRLASAQPAVDLLRSIGVRLRAHVQFEERELFPYLEQSLEPRALEAIGSRLAASREAR